MENIDTTQSINLLSQSLQELCDIFNKQGFFPLLEADITAYIYHRLVCNGCPPSSIFCETRVRGVKDDRRRYDLVIGNVDTINAWVNPVLIVQVKCFQRWGFSPHQHHRRFEDILKSDLPSLGNVVIVPPVGRIEVVTDLVFKPRTVGYLSGIRQGVRRKDELMQRCKKIGVSLIWVRPNTNDVIEIEKLV